MGEEKGVGGHLAHTLFPDVWDHLGPASSRPLTWRRVHESPAALCTPLLGGQDLLE